MTVGGISVVVCLFVITTMVAHGHDRISMRNRIVLGLMMTNTVYSSANIIPINELRTGVLDCGRLVLSFDKIRFGRALWFCGKYGLVSFELFILGASIRALLYCVTAVPRRVAAAMYTICCIVALSAFVVFYALCSKINADGYNSDTENEAYTNVYDHASTNDDLDDDQPSVAASVEFQSAREKYDELMRNMLLAWDVFAGLTILLWITLRLLHRHAQHTLDNEALMTSQAEVQDVWADTRRSVWKARRNFLNARREAFAEVAKPLEPYIAVFVLFAVPAFVMSTAFCENSSGASAANDRSVASANEYTTDISYGTCDVWCEFVLAFRTLSTVGVYLMSYEHRAEIVAVRTTWHKLCTRIVRCVQCGSASYTLFNQDSGNEILEMLALEQQPSDGLSASTNDALTCIDESDIEMLRVLGHGAFGEVWEGRLHPNGLKVAIKVIVTGAVDDEGDPLDVFAEEDFRKECEVLHSIDNPHLLKLIGFGTTASGSMFIVTELLAGGSLRDLLRNAERDLQWHTRLKIALQVALGMKYLHERHMLHRDLKSANVLLDEQLRAKVCDFGLSRVVRPSRPRVVHSPFTGVTRLLPHVHGVEINDTQSVSSLENVAVNVVDVRGTMTKAAGTLLWMAPEVYRGDQNYTGAVDVYSYGIVLWELATRNTPWVDELSSDTVFFEQLNRALQTGRRPVIPDDVVAEHGEFVSVMRRCWAGDPADRPTFAEVATDLFFACFKE